MNNNNIIFSKKKINLMLPILLVSALILGPLATGNDVFATLDCCAFKQTQPNAANTGGGSNTTNQGATATTSSSPTTGTLQVSLDNQNSVSATYAVTVTGNNPQPSSFSISATSPQFVKLGPGSFAVSIDTSVPHSFSGDCKGTMSAGELQSCTIHITGPSQ